MILNWSNEFEAAGVATYGLVTLLLLVTLVPGMTLVVLRLVGTPERKHSVGCWLCFFSVSSLSWFLLVYSLAFASTFAPNEAKAVAEAPMGMDEIIAQNAEIVDRRNLMGRGGVIGNLDFAFFRTLSPQGNSDQPMFSSRRPFHQVPHALFQVYQLAIYLAATGAMVVAFLTRWSWLKSGIAAIAWGALVYAPLVHWVWGDGWLSMRGAFDFGGGMFFLVVGSSLAAALKVHAQPSPTEAASPPRADGDIVLASGFALFLAGSAMLNITFSMPGPGVQAVALLNCVLSFGTACAVWCGLSRLSDAKVSNDTSVYGAIAGLSVACGASGLLVPVSALIAALAAATIGFGVSTFAAKLPHHRPAIVCLACIAIPAAVGLLATGIFGHENYGVRHWNGEIVSGVAEGNTVQFQLQGITVCVVATVAFTVSRAICVVGDKTSP